MAQDKTNSNTRNSNSHPPRRGNRNNQRANENNSSIYEFNSYTDQIIYTTYGGGYNLLDYYTEEQIAEIIKNPMLYHDEIREISLQLYGSNGSYSNTVDYLTALHTLDRVIVSHGKNEKKKQQNKELMNATLNTIKDREFIRDALFRGMVEGTA